jgi:hypothetical protein
MALLLGPGLALAAPRTWNLKSGATVTGDIVGFPNNDSVTIQQKDGKPYTLQEAYLSGDDRSFVDAERAKQWKQVSVDRLLGSLSAGRYKKCSVSGTNLGGMILVTLLPAQVEPILAQRRQQEAQIAALQSQIQADETTVHDANKPLSAAGSRAARNANRAAAKSASQDESNVKISLVKLKVDYDAYVKKTKAATTLLMKNTGTFYEGMPVWECQTPRK